MIINANRMPSAERWSARPRAEALYVIYESETRRQGRGREEEDGSNRGREEEGDHYHTVSGTPLPGNITENTRQHSSNVRFGERSAFHGNPSNRSQK